MKIKYILPILALLLGNGQAFGQKGAFDLGLGLGYGFKSAPFSEINQSDNTSTNITYSLGSGFHGSISASYMLGEHIGAGLGLAYVTGSKAEYRRNLIGSNGYGTTTLKGSMMSIMPNIILSANSTGINPYGRFGVVLGSAQATNSEITTGGSGTTSGPYELKYSGNMAIGWYVGFGAQYSISDKIMLNAELFNRSMSYAPKKVDNTYNGGWHTDPTIYFVKNPSQGSRYTYTESQIYFPFSSIGIMVGISVRLGGGNKAAKEAK